MPVGTEVGAARQGRAPPSEVTVAAPRSDKPSFWFLGVGAASLALLGLPGHWRGRAVMLVGLAGVVATAAGARYNRPRRPGAWYALALGQALLVAGGLLAPHHDVMRRAGGPSPSYGDAAHVAGYLSLAIGLALIVRARRPGRDVNSLIDASLVTVAAAVGAWLFLVAPAAPEPRTTAVVYVAYPAADLLLVAVAARLVFTADTRAFSYRLIAAGLISRVVADVFFLHAWSGSFRGGGPIEAGWLASYLFWGASALHPSMRVLSDPVRHLERARYTRRRLATEASAVVAIPSMWIVQTLRDVPGHPAVVVGGSAIAALLVVSRAAGLMTALESAALHDPLTGLPNRRLLLDRIAQAFRRAERTKGLVAVLFIDLGGFKRVNDRYGHDAGDQALIEIAERLRSVVRRSDTVARLGGDEFVILCEEVERSYTDALAHRIRSNVSKPIDIRGNWVEMSVDVGVALEMVPAEGNVDQLIAAADRAMYRAKHSAREGSPGPTPDA